MLYARVVVGLAVDGPFDYIVPADLEMSIEPGVRAYVEFRTQKMMGYVVGLRRKTKIKGLKTISEVIDNSPLLSKNMLSLTKELAGYYCCSWGEAIETALPDALRRGRLLPVINTAARQNSLALKEKKVILIHALEGEKRWQVYIQEIKSALAEKRPVIILLPDIDSVMKAKEIIEKNNVGASLAVLHRKRPGDLEEWTRVKNAEANVVVGTRAGIFAPFNNLGLVIIDEEQESVYKQEQSPHYHARDIAFMRAEAEKAKLILGSSSPSLESFYLAKKSKIQYIFIPGEKAAAEVKIIDTRNPAGVPRRKDVILSGYLKDSISTVLNSKGRALLFINRKGFATFAYCLSCGNILRCLRCNINLVYHFKDNLLSCHYCNFKTQPPSLCPACNSGYIKYSGIGTEKIESELSRIFPQARIKILDNLGAAAVKEAEIIISTELILKGAGDNFNLVGVLSIDNSLNRIDFRSAEKVFYLLTGLSKLTQEKIVIQTGLPNYYVFKALAGKDINIFYNEELRQRRQLGFPPYQHTALVKLRGKKESRVKEVCAVLFDKLKEGNKNKAIKVVSLNPGQPAKLRGNFYWQILIRANNAKQISRFLKIYLRKFLHSGTILTVDIDPL